MKKIGIVAICVLTMLLSMSCSLKATEKPVTEDSKPVEEYITDPAIETTQTPGAEQEKNELSEKDLENARKIAEDYVMDLAGKSNGTLKYSELRFDPDDLMRQNYRAGISLENIVVFKVDLDVQKAWNGFDARKYTDWSIIVTRSGIDSNWQFEGAGY
jgi:hypothetical protein